MEPAVHGRLAAAAAVTSLVGERIYPVRIPQDATYPALAYTRVSTTRESAMGDDPGIVRARCQVSAWATTEAVARQVSDAARDALQRWRGTVNGIEVLDVFVEAQFGFYEDESELYQHVVDLQVIHRE